MLSLFISVLFNLNIHSSSQTDTPCKEGKQITDSLGKIYNKKVIGYTTVNKQITRIKYIIRGREFELPLTGFRIETPVVIVKKRKTSLYVRRRSKS
jgi:hypothetical protein